MFRMPYFSEIIRADFHDVGRDFESAEMFGKQGNRGAAPFGGGNT
jgi:hypothetical protein